MSSNLNDQLKNYLRSNRVKNPINITFTQKQKVDGKWIDDFQSEQNFKHFKNVLNRKVFGNGYKRFNKQLEMLVIREVSLNQRHHLHCIIELPLRYWFDEFSSLIKNIWKNTKFGYDQIDIEKPSSQLREDGWLEYIMKDFTKVSLSTSIDYENSSVLIH